MPENGDVVLDKNKANKNEDFFEKNELKNNKVVPAILISILLLLFIVFGGYFYFSRPSKIVVNSIDTLYNDLIKLINPNSNIREFDTMLMDMNFKLNTNIEGLEDLSKEEINYKMGLDYPNKIMTMDVSWEEDTSTILGLMYFLINDKAYMKFANDDKLIEVDTEDESSLDFENIFSNSSQSLDYDDTIYVLEELKNAFVNSLDMGVLKKSRDVIKINGEEKKVTKISYPLTSKNVEKIVNNFVNKVTNNSKLLDKLSSMYEIDVDTLKANLEEMKNISYSDYGEINFFTDSFTTDLLMLEFSSDGMSYGITFNSDDTEIIINNGEFDTIITFKVISEEEINVDFKVQDAGVSGKLIIKATEVSDNKYTLNMDFKLKYFVYDFGFNIDTTIETGAEINHVDVNNSVKLSTMDPNELQNIVNNMMEKVNNSNLFKLLGNTNQDMDI